MKKIDVFLNKLLSSLRTTKIYPFLFQLLIFSIFCFLFISLINRNEFSSLKLGMIIVWHIWWPLIPILVIFTGRLWCSICPFSSTANLLNKIFPYRMFNGRLVIQYGFIVALFVFAVIVAIDIIFVIKFNQYYTLIFFLTLFSMLIAIAIMFDYKTYCNTICPFGLISKIYNRFSFLKIKDNDNICSECKKEAWIKSAPIGELKKNNSEFENRDWKFKLECLKGCRVDSMKILYVNPLKENPSFDGLKLAEALAPSMIIILFSVYVFLKSNYFINIYNNLQLSFTFSLNFFIITIIILAIIINILINMAIINVSSNVLKIENTIAYKGFYSLTPLLIFFHISLVLRDMRGITSLGHLYPALGFLEHLFPSEDNLQSIAYFLTFIGIFLSAVSFFYITKLSNKLPQNISSAFMFMFSMIFAFNSFLALATIKYSQYFS